MASLVDRLIPDAVADAALDLFRCGATPEALHRAVFPEGEPSVAPALLYSLLEAMDVQRAATLPPDDLPPTLDEAQSQLTTARVALVQAIEDDPGNGSLHSALAKNVAVALGVEKFRLDRVVHRHNLKVMQDRQRAAALETIRPGRRDPFPGLPPGRRALS